MLVIGVHMARKVRLVSLRKRIETVDQKAAKELVQTVLVRPFPDQLKRHICGIALDAPLQLKHPLLRRLNRRHPGMGTRSVGKAIAPREHSGKTRHIPTSTYSSARPQAEGCRQVSRGRRRKSRVMQVGIGRQLRQAQKEGSPAVTADVRSEWPAPWWPHW